MNRLIRAVAWTGIFLFFYFMSFCAKRWFIDVGYIAEKNMLLTVFIVCFFVEILIFIKAYRSLVRHRNKIKSEVALVVLLLLLILQSTAFFFEDFFQFLDMQEHIKKITFIDPYRDISLDRHYSLVNISVPVRHLPLRKIIGTLWVISECTDEQLFFEGITLLPAAARALSKTKVSCYDFKIDKDVLTIYGGKGGFIKINAKTKEIQYYE